MQTVEVIRGERSWLIRVNSSPIAGGMFLDKEKARAFAVNWARENRPSKVIVTHESGDKDIAEFE